MEQYISKSALVAEIEKLKAYLQIPNAHLEAIKVCDNVISVIDTLEMKYDIQDVEKVSENSDTLEEKTWKPNEEQMRAFSTMIRFVKFATSFDAHKQRLVESLYQELSKLVLK